VHTTQFAIREPKHGLFKPVLEIVGEELGRVPAGAFQPIKVAGVCGDTRQALTEAALVKELHYDAALLSLAALKDSDEEALLAHCRAVAEILPVIGFYLQPAVGGRVLPYSFWRRFAEIENVVAIKIAPFNRYQTLDVVRAVAMAGRDDVALYTGNDDNIVLDLLTAWQFQVEGRTVQRRISGGLLGHWAVWTRRAVALLEEVKGARERESLDARWLTRAQQVTDANAALFDAANGFRGCIAGLHEVLRRQGLLQGVWCLDEHETFGPGQLAEIDRVYRAYPYLNDDEFVRENLDRWLR
jgi:hypothetical protein